MRISRNPILNAELPFLVCSLYTLFETHKTFTLTNIKQDIYSNLNNDNYFSIEMESFKEFYKLLNKLSLRRFSYILIKPILNRDYLLFYGALELGFRLARAGFVAGVEFFASRC